uniref:Uncharacterized protein n=1 Tax=Romanomermis culicivorax TaxID=13658 RepID=A0A915I8P2_ROMCU
MEMEKKAEMKKKKGSIMPTKPAIPPKYQMKPSLTANKICCNDTNTLFGEKSFASKSNIRNLLNAGDQIGGWVTASCIGISSSRIDFHVLYETIVSVRNTRTGQLKKNRYHFKTHEKTFDHDK